MDGSKLNVLHYTPAEATTLSYPARIDLINADISLTMVHRTVVGLPDWSEHCQSTVMKFNQNI